MDTLNRASQGHGFSFCAAAGSRSRETEGWPAGIYLTMLAARDGGHAGPEATAVPPGAPQRLIEDCLRTEVLATMPPDDRASTAVLFLAGKGNILRDFSVEPAMVPDQPAGSVGLKLTPKRPEREYEWLELVVDATSYGLRMLVTKDAQGGTSTFRFTNLRENVDIPDKEFVFTMPKGVDVVTDAGR